MKKIFIILIALMLTMSVFLISACGNTSNQANVSSETSSEEDSSSATKLSRAFGSKTAASTQISTSTSQGTTSQTSSADASVSGDGYTVPTTPVPSGVSTNVSMLITQINYIGSVTSENYAEKLDIITECESFYENDLSSSEKAQVTNIEDLRKARAAYDKFNVASVTVNFRRDVLALPEAANLKKSNVATVYALRDMLNTYRESLTADLSDIDELEAKLTACYNTIMDAMVEYTIIAQDTNGNGIMESSITWDSGKIRNELTAEKRRSDNGNEFFTFSESTSSGSESQSIIYSDKNNTNVKIWVYYNGTLTFTAPCPGTLTCYIRKGQSRTYVATLDDEEIGTFVQTSSMTNDSDVTWNIDITKAGAVKVATTSSKGYFYAVKFSYPNLPD